MIYTPKLAEYIDESGNSISLPENDNDIMEAYQLIYARTIDLIQAMEELNGNND